MDDKQYYSIKRITSLTVEQLQKNLSKEKGNKKIIKIENTKYRENSIHQGHDDAQMLLEKQNNFDSIE